MEIYSHYSDHNKRIINYKLEWYFFQYTVRYFTITFGRQILKLSEWDGKVYWFKSWNTDRYSMSKTCGRNNYIWYHSHSKKGDSSIFHQIMKKKRMVAYLFCNTALIYISHTQSFCGFVMTTGFCTFLCFDACE